MITLDGITRFDIETAMNGDYQEIIKQFPSSKYNLVFKGEQYPPKVVLGIAYLIHVDKTVSVAEYKKLIEKHNFNSNTLTREFLKNKGFQIMSKIKTSEYVQFKYLLKRFVEQANKNILNQDGRSPSLGNVGFEENKFEYDKRNQMDCLHIGGIEFHVHLKVGSSYGPRKGNGSGKAPFFDYELCSGRWCNIRAVFSESKITTLKVVIWHSDKDDEETEVAVQVDKLDLFSNLKPNEHLIKFYDQFMEFKEKEQDTMVNESVQKLIETLNQSYNIILRGAPGTGKTFLAQQIVASMISEGRTTNIENLTAEENKQLGFVQFHPSYDYTDFVEGLRPTISEKEVGFELEPGIFKAFCERANRKKSEKDEESVDDTKPYIFIIDEINRGEISKIFGELFFSIDPGYRGPKGGILTQYSNLHDDKEEKFFIPKNVYIIGTMNDIDRSVDTFDFAMRRRFTFLEITAEQSANNMLKSDDTKALMARLNRALVDKSKGGLTRDYEIGASYFLTIDGEGTARETIEPLWNNKLLPLLIDYFRGEHESEKKIRLMEDAYFENEGEA